MYIAAKAHAPRPRPRYVTPQDVKEVAYNVLRHRILLNFEGEAEEDQARNRSSKKFLRRCRYSKGLLGTPQGSSLPPHKHL